MLVAKKKIQAVADCLNVLMSVLLFAVALIMVQQAQGQQLVLPVSADHEPSLAVTLDQLKLTTYNGEAVGLNMQLCVIGQLPREQRLMVTPRLTCGSHTADFPTLTVFGRWAYYSQVRGGAADSTLMLCYRDKEMRTFCNYRQTTGYEPWMREATLTLAVNRTDGCGNSLVSDERTALPPRQVLLQRQDEGWRDVQTEQLNGTAYVVFPVAKTEVLTDFGSNRRELGSLCRVVDSLRLSPHVNIHRIAIKGYASPEGSYANNDRLARERTDNLARYLADHCGLSIALISTSHVAEDWQGLRRHVAESRMVERDALLDIIDSPMEPDARLALLAKRHPVAYKRLSEEVFPLLRHTDYEIDYTLNTVTEHQGRLYVDTLLRLDADSTVAPPPTVERRRISTYRPWIALKTNLLYDLAAAPNIEVEVPLGRSHRWSLMAEYCNPWWRWDRKSQSYEIQEAGGELRRWLGSRCDGGRPLLCGTFVGVYGAWGKYDLERNDVGDQGDVLSAGLTLGRAWPLGRHWNLEASVSAGAIWGERRHYNAEFESTHLIYKYTKNLFYAGPTKLKLSLVWIIGGPSKKGGGA